MAHMRRRIGSIAVVLSSIALGAALLAVPVAGTAGAADSADRATPKHFCHGQRATIVGTAKADWLLGTQGRDVIWAGNGPDTVAALDGRDIVCGGRGADVLEGSGGQDRLYGDKGRDMCTGEDGEHRHHYSCETHLNVFGYQVDPPNAPGGAGRNVVRAEKVAPADVPEGAFRGDTYFAADYPLCAPDGVALTTVHLGNVYFKTYYMDPGYIAIRPAYFRVGDSGFMQGPFYESGWRQLSAPADGGVYQYDMVGATVPRSDRVYWIYEVFWWDGFNWTNFDKIPVPGHYLQTTTGPVYTGVCWV
jgi:hypothetical protein